MNKETIEKKLKEATDPDFWGSVTIDYQAGRPVIVRKIEVNKLTNEEDNSREKPIRK